MIFFAAIILGALTGWLRASRRNGNRFDKLQYAAVHAIFFAIIGLFATILYQRMT
ncbi:MAG: hypothetical protein R3E44_13820 [Paracoccaceae bacterium]